MSRATKRSASLKGKCIAVIVDMVRSRDLANLERANTQERFTAFVDLLNRKYDSALASRFAITLGDEFQGLLLDPAIIPDLVWDIETRFTGPVLRIGFGLGALSTPLREFAINIDGPALHEARASIEIAKKADYLGGVFSGFGESENLILNGFARLLRSHRAVLYPQQMKIVELLRQGLTQTEAARVLRLTKQAVSKSAKASGWVAYQQGEQGWRAALTKLVSLE